MYVSSCQQQKWLFSVFLNIQKAMNIFNFLTYQFHEF